MQDIMRSWTYLKSLSAAATQIENLVVPHVVAIAENWLVLEWLVYTEFHDWRASLGSVLAQMHQTSVVPERKFGASGAYWLGHTRLPGAHYGTWHEVLSHMFLGPLVDQLSGDVLQRGKDFIEQLPDLLPGSAPPCLCHGDLWSGNAMPVGEGKVALVDPACLYAPAAHELGMTQLFGFGQAFDKAYAQAAQASHTDALVRELGTLVHLLNHAVLFGGGYSSQAMAEWPPSVVRWLPSNVMKITHW